MVNAESRWFVYLQTEIEQRTLSCFTIENSLNVSLNSLLSCVNLCQGTVQTNRTSALRKPFFSFNFIIFDIELTFERSVIFLWEKCIHNQFESNSMLDMQLSKRFHSSRIRLNWIHFDTVTFNRTDTINTKQQFDYKI